MSAKLTWSDGVNPSTTLELSDAVVGSLEKYRQEIKAIRQVPLTDPDGNVVNISNQPWPVHETVPKMLFSILTVQVINPALSRFPLPEHEALEAQAEAAQKALADARASAVEVK